MSILAHVFSTFAVGASGLTITFVLITGLDSFASQTVTGNDLSASSGTTLAVAALTPAAVSSLENSVLLDSAHREIARVDDQNKWALSLLGTMAVAVLGLAASNLMIQKKLS